MAIESLTLTEYDDPDSGFRILQLTGPLVLRTMFDFQARVRLASPLHLILDLTGVEYIDSAGLGVILEGHVSHQRREKKMILVGVTPRIETLLQITHTDTILARADTVEDAKR
jgi:anti-sigma B factor antagonist